MDPIPTEFVQRIEDIARAVARQWIAQLPTVIESLAEQWSLTVDPPFPSLSYSYVAPATRHDGTEAVLKLRLPGTELVNEAACLMAYAGSGAVRLLESDVDRGALLLERIRPGTDASALADADAVQCLAMIMQRIHKPIQSAFPFPSVADWGKGFQRHQDSHDGGSGPLPSELFNDAQAKYAELATSMEDSVLLHGDLHHQNILAGERQQWLAIDPQGVVGEPAYEIGAFLRNPIDTLSARPDLDSVMSQRASMLSEAIQVDRDRIVGWGMAQAALAAIWSYEDHGNGWEEWIRVAHALRAIDSSA